MSYGGRQQAEHFVGSRNFGKPVYLSDVAYLEYMALTVVENELLKIALESF